MAEETNETKHSTQARVPKEILHPIPPPGYQTASYHTSFRPQGCYTENSRASHHVALLHSYMSQGRIPKHIKTQAPGKEERARGVSEWSE